ncbi:hypothetical protein SK128_010994 [Halocaridina rubra]|uniref:Uncharacterized protein n=1 Tax=Halocaridina rubra TaxID=373956 RepID=A0AAN9AEZ1_HALRR
MLLKVFTCIATLMSLTVGLPTARPQSYSALSVTNIDANVVGGTDEFMNMVFEILPQIQELVKNVTTNASKETLKEATRFKDIIELFIPFMRKTLEFEAEDQGRVVKPEDIEALDTAEFALYYISDLLTSDLNLDVASEGVVIPDYTDLLLDIPDVNIPEVVIPEVKIPDVTIPEINIPGSESIPEMRIPIPSIPAVNIPGRVVPVTSAPVRAATFNKQPSVTQRPTFRIIKRPLSASSKNTSKVTTKYPSPLTTTIKYTTPAPTTRPTAPPVTTTPATPVPAVLTASVWNSRRVSPSYFIRQNYNIGDENASVFSRGEPKTSDSSSHVERSVSAASSPVVFYTLPGGGYFYRG